jgi:hypothetical protein
MKAKRNVTQKGSIIHVCFNGRVGREAYVGYALWLVKSVLKDGSLKVAGLPYPVKSWVTVLPEDVQGLLNVF